MLGPTEFLVRIDYERVNGERGSVAVPFKWVYQPNMRDAYVTSDDKHDPPQFNADDWVSMHEIIMLSIPEGDYERTLDNIEFAEEGDLSPEDVARWSYHTDEIKVKEAEQEAYGE